MARFADTFALPVPGDDDDDWGSDFEEELCSQEIEDNKINEIREANLLKNPPNNVQGSDAQTMQIMTGSRYVNAMKTGAIPKSGFSYLNNTVIMDDNRAFQTIVGKECGNNARSQRQESQSEAQSTNTSMNSENYERQPHTQINSNNEAVAKKTPRKLKPEAFSFLNKLPQRNVTDIGSDMSKERKTLVPTVFAHAEKLNFSQSQDDSNMTFSGSPDAPITPNPSAPPLENSNNYETITEEPFSEFALPLTSSTIGKENEKPPLPIRPPPVFKYPPETFSSSRSSYEESMCNVTIPNPLSLFAPVYPKLDHSISSPDSDLKCTNVVTHDKILGSKVKNRKSLPSIPSCPAVPKRPLPPLPISGIESVGRTASQGGTVKLESPDPANEENRLEPPTPISTTSSQQTNQFSESEAPVLHTAFKEPVSEEQLISNPQYRLAQRLANQTSVDSAILISQQKIASAITSRAIESQSSSFPRLQKTDNQNGGKPKELGRIPGSFRSLENDVEETNELESERQPSYLEAKEAINPRRFNDPETLISAMNRPMLPQKAAPIQRSVSCNSLVQSIKDLGFSVWSKPEKKRNSDGISLSKKNTRTTSLTSSSKVKSTAPIQITLIPTDVPSEVNNLHHVKNDAALLDKKSTLQEYPWFHDVEAKEGQFRLLSVGQDGTFLIRPSSRPTEDIQNTLCIFYNGKVRNLHIRTTADGRYVLGSKNSRTFSTLTEMIRYHREIPVEILPQGSTPLKPKLYRILLTETPPKLQKIFTIV